MSSVLTDFANGVVCRAALPAGSFTGTASGGRVDLTDGDGGAFAVLLVGTLGAGTTVAGLIEESDDDETWTPIPGAEFAAVTAAGTVRAASFRRTARYVRATLALAGTSPQAYAAVFVGQQRKLF